MLPRASRLSVHGWTTRSASSLWRYYAVGGLHVLKWQISWGSWHAQTTFLVFWVFGFFLGGGGVGCFWHRVSCSLGYSRTSLCRTDWPRTEGSSCLCIPSAGIKDVYYTTIPGFNFYFQLPEENTKISSTHSHVKSNRKLRQGQEKVVLVPSPRYYLPPCPMSLNKWVTNNTSYVASS